MSPAATLAGMREVTAFAPATIANVGPGFDVLGLALAAPGDRVTARFAGGPGVRLAGVRGDGGRLPTDPERNTAGIAAARVLRHVDPRAGVELELHKGLPLGSGLGSSAASAAAAARAVDALLGAGLDARTLIEACLEAETAVSGRHADNVAAAILGGFVIVRSVDPLEVLRVPFPRGILAAVVTPRFELPTRRAREILPACVPLADAVRNAANLAALVAAAHAGDTALLGRALEDRLATPARAPLVPGCAAVLEAARRAGAIGAGISGAGPSLFALCEGESTARAAGEAMRQAFREAGGLEAEVRIAEAGAEGARCL